MSSPILATKLHVPLRRPRSVHRARLFRRLDDGLHRKLTVIAAPAGFGKTTLAAEWVGSLDRPVAWLSLDEEHVDPARFLAYLLAALQTVDPRIGREASGALRSPQAPAVDVLLASLVNDLSAADPLVLVLDDEHAVAATPVRDAVAFLVRHLPPQVHLVLTTRQDPALPLPRLRAQDQVTELGAADLRFSVEEGAEFLGRVMGLRLPEEALATLDARTEGWIAGLQLAALSLQARADADDPLASFRGDHPFVLDYLVAEVLQSQPPEVQAFLLRTSVLDRLSGPLCDAVTTDPSARGATTLAYLDHAHLFVVPLDDEGHWYRYHHLFAQALRKRLREHPGAAGGDDPTELHRRASAWFEEQGWELEAFRHAAAAHDVDRAERLVEGSGMPLHFRGSGSVVREWLASLPEATLDEKPSLWVTYASVLTFAGTPTDVVEGHLRSAEAALRAADAGEAGTDLVGRIAALRAMQAIPRSDVDTILTQSRRALEFLHPDDRALRPAATWTLGLAHQLRGDLDAAVAAFEEADRAGDAAGNTMAVIGASTSLGQAREAQRRSRLAADSFRRVLSWAGDPPLPAACEAHLGLARLHYAWNELETARRHGETALRLSSHMPSVPTPAACQVLLARVKTAEGDVAGANRLLSEADRFLRDHDFEFLSPAVANARVAVSLRAGDVAAAEGIARLHDLPLGRVRVHLARGEGEAALTLLASLEGPDGATLGGYADLERTILEAVVRREHGDGDEARARFAAALAVAEPEGLLRPFLDEGAAAVRLSKEAAESGVAPDLVGRILAAWEVRAPVAAVDPRSEGAPLDEPLSETELKVLRLTAEGLSNQEIADRLYRALSTVKGHNRNIFGKLQVRRRTEAVARARELGLI